MLIDGGHLRKTARSAKYRYDENLVEQVAYACVDAVDETLMRVLYYDCAKFEGKAKLPVSGVMHEFKGTDQWLRNLATKDYFAVRRGLLKFRGWKPLHIPVAPMTLKDSDFVPDFEQKGVDMRIGLDMANYAHLKSVDRIILVTGDTDCVPAMKYVRKSGLQVVIVTLPATRSHAELLWHADFERKIQWPPGLPKFGPPAVVPPPTAVTPP